MPSGAPKVERWRELDARLWDAFVWLDEATRHLEIIKPQVRHAFTVPRVLRLEAPRYEGGFATYRRRPVGELELLEYVEFFYRLEGQNPVIIRVAPGGAVALEDRLRLAHLQYRYHSEMDEMRSVRAGIFTVVPAVSASVRFTPDYERERVEVVLRNVDRFESMALDFPGNSLSEPVLEDLIQFVLGEGNQFLRRAPFAGVGQGSAGVRASAPADAAAPKTGT